MEHNGPCSNPDCPYDLPSYSREKTWYNPHLECLNCMDDREQDRLSTEVDRYYDDLEHAHMLSEGHCPHIAEERIFRDTLQCKDCLATFKVPV